MGACFRKPAPACGTCLPFYLGAPGKHHRGRRKAVYFGIFPGVSPFFDFLPPVRYHADEN